MIEAHGHTPGSEPWHRRDMAVLLAGSTIGVALLAAAWTEVSAQRAPGRQMVWLTVAVGAVVVGGATNGLWILAGRRALGVRRERLLAEVHAHTGLRKPLRASRRDGLVAAAGMRHYHRPACQLVVGKHLATAGRAEHASAGLQPCGMCEP